MKYDIAAKAIDIGKKGRDIMIESPIYDLIKKEGLYDTVSLGLEIKFGMDGVALIEKIRKIDSVDKLETLKEAIRLAKNIEEFEKLI